MTKEQFLRSFEQIVETDPNTLNGSELLENIENWDSVSMVSLIAMVDEQASVKLAPRQIREAVTVDDLFALTQQAAR